MSVSWLRKAAFMKRLPIFVEVFSALAVGGIMILLAGKNPLVGYMTMLDGAFGNIDRIIDVLVGATPLLLCGLGIIICFKCKIFNMGGQGQIAIGAIASTWIALTFSALNPILLLPLTIISGFVAAALFAGIVGLLQVKLSVNEIISFLMMNYIAYWFMDYLLLGPMADPASGGFAYSSLLPSGSWLPVIPGTSLHVGFFFAILTMFVVYFLFRNTTIGYKIKVTGSNTNMARYGGIRVSSVMLFAVLLGGGLCGLAGTFEILGIHHRLIESFDPGYGWTGIAVARAANLHPFAAGLTAFFFGALRIGCDYMARTIGVPVYLTDILYGLVIIFVIAGESLREVWPEWRKKI